MCVSEQRGGAAVNDTHHVMVLFLGTGNHDARNGNGERGHERRRQEAITDAARVSAGRARAHQSPYTVLASPKKLNTLASRVLIMLSTSELVTADSTANSEMGVVKMSISTASTTLISTMRSTRSARLTCKFWWITSPGAGALCAAAAHGQRDDNASLPARIPVQRDVSMWGGSSGCAAKVRATRCATESC